MAETDRKSIDEGRKYLRRVGADFETLMAPVSRPRAMIYPFPLPPPAPALAENRTYVILTRIGQQLRGMPCQFQRIQCP